MKKLSDRPYIFFIALIVLAALLHKLAVGIHGFYYQGILSMYYIFVEIAWVRSLRRRLMQKQVRTLMTAFCYLMIVWLLLRAVKYELTTDTSDIGRLLWYAYYIPLSLMPVLMFLSTLYIGKSDDYAVSRRWYLLFLPAACLMLGVLTNDVHQYAFRLHMTPSGWDGGYTRGPIYYAVAVFCVISVAAMMIVVFRNCVRRRFIRTVWVPLAVSAIGIAYWLLYDNYDPNKFFVQVLFELPEMVGVLSILFWEGMAAVHLIPTNTHHNDFFSASSIRAGLTDAGYHTVLHATDAALPSAKQVQLAQRNPVLLADGATLLKSYAVRGGYFYWMEDIGEILRINEKLADTEDYLLEENAMLNAANELRESVRTTAEQNELYDRIAESIRPQLEKVEAILDTLPEEEAAFRRRMKTAAVYGAYIKRYSNLLLIAGSGSRIDIEELALALAELLEYVKLLDVVCDVHVSSGYMLEPSLALLIYGLTESLLETALPTLTAVMVRVSANDRELRYYAELSAEALFVEKRFYEQAKALGATLETEYSDGCYFVNLVALAGGDGI